MDIIGNNGSQRITQSPVLSGLKIALFQKALVRSSDAAQAVVGAWVIIPISDTSLFLIYKAGVDCEPVKEFVTKKHRPMQ
ncbi:MULTISPECIES: hypothetical protein [Cyanophyceae]|uniref:hypothetical protein n=1 Tax=Cyanophyceae TaxID=3028117 RepID=UPI0016861787|nr:hypothetical protein [Trichocoleus sp. FACHB-69]MBD1932665.1 hypothetical protein [Trichocoleus sp. FACHB-69]